MWRREGERRPDLYAGCVRCNSAAYLVLIGIGEIDLIRELYETVLVPEAVVEELSAHRTPMEVRLWVPAMPEWVSVSPSRPASRLPFASLGLGERQAIALAQETAKSLLLTDDFQARVAAESVGIQVVPTIRVLSTAGALSLVDFDDAVRRLRQTNFRVSQKVIDRIASSRL